jgi:hypothetical protein
MRIILRKVKWIRKVNIDKLENGEKDKKVRGKIKMDIEMNGKVKGASVEVEGEKVSRIKVIV